MSKNICSICKNKFEDKYFNKKQDKCILHSEKSLRMTAHTDIFYEVLVNHINEENLIYDNKLILKGIKFPNFKIEDIGDYTRSLKNMCTNIEFIDCDFYSKWLSFRDYKCCFLNCEFLNNINILNIENLHNTFLFNECIFLKKVTFFDDEIKSDLFDFCKFHNGVSGCNTIFKGMIFSRIDSFKGELRFSNSVFEKRFIIDNKNIKINKLDFEDTVLKDKVKLQFINISDANFYNTKFKDLADFYGSNFENVNISRVKFNDMAVFTKTNFSKNLDLKYVKFFEEAIFREMNVFGELNLREVSFMGKTNFLDAKINVENRETARIIKDSFEQQNNFIEANKYYAKEMEAYEKELSFLNTWDWSVLKFHGITSEYSQNWILPLVWIFNISSLYFLIDSKLFYFVDKILFGGFLFIGIIFVFNYLNKYLKNVFILLFTIFLYSFFDIDLDEIARMVNPFSKAEEVIFSELVLKVIIGYLIYQFVVSLRQNTRRK